MSKYCTLLTKIFSVSNESFKSLVRINKSINFARWKINKDNFLGHFNPLEKNWLFMNFVIQIDGLFVEIWKAIFVGRENGFSFFPKPYGGLN